MRKSPTRTRAEAETEAAKIDHYVDPYLFEIGFFKDAADYERSTRRMIEAISTGKAKWNPRALRS